jgi:hypothetical protein
MVVCSEEGMDMVKNRHDQGVALVVAIALL